MSAKIASCQCALAKHLPNGQSLNVGKKCAEDRNLNSKSVWWWIRSKQVMKIGIGESCHGHCPFWFWQMPFLFQQVQPFGIISKLFIYSNFELILYTVFTSATKALFNMFLDHLISGWHFPLFPVALPESCRSCKYSKMSGAKMRTNSMLEVIVSACSWNQSRSRNSVNSFRFSRSNLPSWNVENI